MRPVSVYIKGDFWDSQIYSGDLILLGAEGAIHRIDWAAVVDDLATTNPRIQTALRVAFADSDLFYTPKVRKILRDPEVEFIVKGQLQQLASLEISANHGVWAKHWRTVEGRLDFLPTDTEVYYNRFFAAGDGGLFSYPRSSLGVESSTRQDRHHDGKILQIKASNQSTSVAAAAGIDGLFEFGLLSREASSLASPQQVAQIPCSACDWAFQSIVAWDLESAYFASFRQIEDPRSKKKHRQFHRVIRENQILEGQGEPSVGRKRMWGSHEKLFFISSDGLLDVLDYIPPAITRASDESGGQQPRFSKRGNVPGSFDANSIVATGTAPFGTVLEFDDEIRVLRSDGFIEKFQGAPVHWRVFPRSEYYSNQLHIIYEDHLRIVSFMHDYFVDQATKLTGFAMGRSSSS
jgi:hypothetical protein